MFKVLHNTLFYAGYLSIIVISAVISHFGHPDVGFGIFAVAMSMLVLLLIISAVINRNNKRAIASAAGISTTAASAPAEVHSFHASASYQHDAHTVWSLIRPAESAVLLSDAKHGFTVPGTPIGAGEQQCFIGQDGSASIIEVIGEESPWWATTRPISQDRINQRFTYRLEPTPSGCILTMGAVLELPGGAAFASSPHEWWESYSRPYLNRVQEVLSMRQR